MHSADSAAPSRALVTSVPVACLLGCACLLLWGIAEVWPWIADDAFISLRYAERLLEGKGLTWNDGERVEGYSNLLWLVAVASLRASGLDWIAAARAVGVAGTALAFAFLLWSGVLGRARGRVELGALLALAALSATATWTIGALETSRVMGLLAGATALIARGGAAAVAAQRTRSFAGAGVLLAGLVLSRPDGPLWTAVAALAALAASRGRTAVLLPVLLPPVLAWGAQLGFRLAYYGEWLPNTAHAKLAPSAASLEVGLEYLLRGARSMAGILVLAAIGVAAELRHRPLRPVAVFCATGIVAWCGYVVLIGGDLFPRFRMLVPALVPLAVLAASGLRAIASRGRYGPAAAWLLAAAAVVLARVDARRADDDPWQRLSLWEWQGRATGEWLGRAFAQQRPLLALDPAGAVAFYSRLPCLDMMGLCDAHIARAPLPDDGVFLPGHFRGDGGYVLSREPDLVLFGQPPGSVEPQFGSGKQMESDPRFLQEYRCAVLRSGPWPIVGAAPADLKVTLWVRVEGRVGVRRQDGRVTVPGWLLGSFRPAVPLRRWDPFQEGRPGDIERVQAALACREWWHAEAAVGVFDAQRGVVVGELRQAGTFLLQGLRLEAGGWLVRAEPDVAALRWRLLSGGGPLLQEDGAWRVPAGGGPVDLECRVGPDAALPVQIERIELWRGG